MIPSPLNKYLKSIEYATSEVTLGKNMATRKKPLIFKVASFNSTDRTNAKRIMIGTWIIKYVKVLINACFKVGSPNSRDRKSTRLNSSHVAISYAVFCLKK